MATEGAHDAAPAGAAVTAFERHRPLLFALAYRMLGSVADAEDMVQESFLRWQAVAADREGEPVRSPRDFLATVVTRLCLDHLRRDRVRREAYAGPWLPEPLETPDGGDPAARAELAESLSLAFLALLERLTPAERAAFLLHDVFVYDYAAIGAIVGKSEAACRQLARRARARIEEGRPRFPATPEDRERLAGAFARACAEGDLAGLVATLAEDVTVWADGGGKALAARRPIAGAERVAGYVLGILGHAPAGATARPAIVNGDPAFVAEVDGQPFSVLALEIAGGRIAAIRIVVNPDKLGGVGGGRGPMVRL